MQYTIANALSRYLLATFFLSFLTPIGRSQACDLALRRVVALEYPWFARMAVLQGSVELNATISKDGTVTNVAILSGTQPLAQAAKEALLTWRFTACPSANMPRQAGFVFEFSLDGSCSASEHCPPSFEIDLPGKVYLKAKRIKAIVN